MLNKKYISITISKDDLNIINDALLFLRNDIIVHAKKHKHTLSQIDLITKELKSDRWDFNAPFIDDCAEY